jgi:hypothetical protein
MPELTQQNSTTGHLVAPSSADKAAGDWKLDCVQLFKDGKTREARTLLCQSTPEEADDIFRWMYDNLDLWAKDPERQDQAIIIIRNGLGQCALGRRSGNQSQCNIGLGTYHEVQSRLRLLLDRFVWRT